MAIAFILIGIVAIVAAVRGTHAQFFALLKEDFTGPNNFVIWLACIFAIGALGYIKQVRPISYALLALVIIVMILAQQKNNGGGGFFEMLEKQLLATRSSAPTTTAASSSQSGGDAISALEGAASSASSLLSQGEALLGLGG